MSKKDRIPAEDFQAFVASLEKLSAFGRGAITNRKEDEFLSTNFTSAVRGLELVYRTIEGLAGSVTTVPAWELLEPLIEKYNKKESSGGPKQIVADGKKEVRRARKGQSKE